MDELDRKSVEEFRQSEKAPVIAVLENVRSAYNVGSVLRTADAFLLQAVYTTGYTAHPPHKQITKTALGADETVTSRHFESRFCHCRIRKLRFFHLCHRTGKRQHPAAQF